MNRSRSLFLIFFSAVLVIVAVVNIVIYEAVIFSFGNVLLPSLVGTALAIGSLGFISTLFLGRTSWYNPLTRAWSRIFSVWIGCLASLFFASVLSILGTVLLGMTSLGDFAYPFSVAVFAAALVATAYGIIHARDIRVKKVSVSLERLPESWQGRKAALISDLHVGQVNGKALVRRIVEKIQEAAPDVVFITGDLFDGSSAPGILESIEPFRDLQPPLGIYFVPGNHEEYGNTAAFFKHIEETGIVVLRERKILLDGVQLIGVGFSSVASEPDFKRMLEAILIRKDVPSILLKHEPRHIEVAEQAGISLQLSGHTHRGQQWPFEYLTRLTYGRFAYGLQKSGAMQAYTTSGVGTWGPPLRVGTDAEIVLLSFEKAVAPASFS